MLRGHLVKPGRMRCLKSGFMVDQSRGSYHDQPDSFQVYAVPPFHLSLSLRHLPAGDVLGKAEQLFWKDNLPERKPASFETNPWSHRLWVAEEIRRDTASLVAETVGHHFKKKKKKVDS